MTDKIDKVDGRINNGGKRPGSGRVKGTPNKITADLKAMMLAALDKVGGVDYLVKQAQENPSSFNLMVSKILPRETALRVEAVSTIEDADKLLKEIGLLK